MKIKQAICTRLNINYSNQQDFCPRIVLQRRVEQEKQVVDAATLLEHLQEPVDVPDPEHTMDINSIRAHD